MQKPWIVWCRPGCFDWDDSALERIANRIDSLGESDRIPMVLIDGSETEAHGVKVQVLRYRMMMVLGPRRVPLIGSIGWWMGVVAVRMVRRMRLHMMIIEVTVRRDLEQVRDSQGQNDPRPERTLEFRVARFHDRGNLAANAPGVNLSSGRKKAGPAAQGKCAKAETSELTRKRAARATRRFS